MQAVYLEKTGDADNLKLVEQPVPQPGPGEVRIEVAAAGINFADVLVRRGLYQPMPELPLVPGLEVAGTIDAIGEGVTHLAGGERVAALVGQGGYARYALASAKGVVTLPDDLTFDLAAGLPVSGMTAYHLTHTVAAPQPGAWVVNYAAAGSVGSLVNGLAKTCGARVIALVGSEKKAARARELGADHVIDYRAHKDVAGAVLDLTAGHGADVIYNSVFGPTVRDDLKMLALRGHIVWYGIAGGLPNPKHLLVALMRRFTASPTFTFYHLITSVKHDARRHNEGWGRLFDYLLARQAELPLHGAYPLSRVAAAHTALENRETMGKLVLHPG